MKVLRYRTIAVFTLVGVLCAWCSTASAQPQNYRWAFDEPNGQQALSALDSGGTNNEGLLHNLGDRQRIPDPPPLLGQGRALRFQSENAAYVSLTSAVVLPDTSDFTLALWYRGTEADDNSYFGRVILGSSGNDSIANLAIITDAADPTHIGQVEFRYFGGGDRIRSTSVVNDGRWHHIAYVNHGATATGDLYIDGVAEVLGSPANNADNMANAGLHFKVTSFMRAYGATGGANNAYTDGELDDVRICRCSLTQADVLTLAPTHRWSMDEANNLGAPELLDGSAAPNHATFHNLTDADRSVDTASDGGRGLRFDAARGSYASLASRIELRDSQDFTLALWYRGTESADNGYFGRVLLGTGGADVTGNLQIAPDSGKVEFRHLGGGDVVRSSSRVNDGRWHHIAYVNHGEAVTGDLYIDGVAEATGQPSNNRDDWDAAGYHFYVRDFMRGYSLTGGADQAFTDGMIDDVRICECAYTETDISQLVPRHSWAFDEADGRAPPEVLDSARNNNGTFVNVSDGSRLDDPATGVGTGRALRFNASVGSYVSLAERVTLRDVDDFSVSFWYRGTETDSNSYFGRLLVGTGSDDLAANIQIAADPDDPSSLGKVEFRHFGGADVVRSTTAINDGRWHHVAYVNDGATVTGTLYVDGVIEVANAPSNNRDDWDAAGHHFYVQNFMRGYSVSAGAGKAFTDGDLDDVEVCRCRLRPTEVASIAATIAADTNHWSLDEADATATPELRDSGAGDHGTVHNLDDADRTAAASSIGAGRALRFTAAHRSYASLRSRITLRDDENFTLSLWYRGTESEPNGHLGRVLVGGDGNDIAANLQIVTDPAYPADVGKVEFRYFGGGSAIRSRSVVNDGEWHHIVYVNHGATRTGDLFVDGAAEVVGAAAANHPAWNAAGYRFYVSGFMRGYSVAEGPGEAFTDGELDDIRICRCSYTESDVSELVAPLAEPDYHWAFDESDSRPAPQVLDASHFLNHGTFQNLTDGDRTTAPPLVGGGRAVRFTAARQDSVILRRRVALRDSEDFTLSLWYRGTESDDNSYLGRVLIGGGGEDIVANLVILTDSSSPADQGKVAFRHYGGGGQVRSTSVVTDGQWHYIVYVNHGLTRSGSLFVDGVPEAEGASSANRDDWNLAGYGFYVDSLMRGYSALLGPNQAFTDGELDDVRICLCRYSTSDISAQYPSAGPADHRWSFNEADGDPAPQIHDDSPIPIHGTLHGMDDSDRIADVAPFLNGGRGLRFAAADGAYVSLQQSIVLRSWDDFSLSLWYRGTESDDNGYFGRTLIGGGGADVSASLQIATDAADPAHIGQVEFRRYGSGRIVRSMTRVNDGAWHHIVYVHRGADSTGSLFIDGVPEAVNEPAENSNGFDNAGLHFYVRDFMRGYSLSQGAQLAFTDGDLDDVRICKCRKTADQVRLEFQGTAGTQSGPINLAEQLVRSDYRYAYGVAAGDLDGDGDQDLVSANAFGDDSDLYWFENDGAGDFVEHRIAVGEAGWLERLTIGDVTGDGRPDVVAVNNRDSHILLYVNNASPETGVWDRRVITAETGRPYDVAIADLDADGRLDVASVSWDNIVTWFRNPGPYGLLQAWPRYIIDNDISEPRTIRIADIDDDGLKDLVVTSAGQQSIPVPASPADHESAVIWYANPGGVPAGSWARRVVDNQSRAPIHGEPIDLDNDGDLDIVMAFGMRLNLAPEELHEVAWYSNGGNGGSWTKQTIGALPFAFEAVSADMDSDGDKDVVASAWSQGDEVVWFENAGNASTWTMHSVRTNWNAANQIIIVDVDGDGLPDIVGTADDGSSLVRGANDLRWWRNRGLH
ncbi:MAG: LamG-like jellyroll fold domain-containing protein [Vicinamibacterales bacterium]